MHWFLDGRVLAIIKCVHQNSVGGGSDDELGMRTLFSFKVKKHSLVAPIIITKMISLLPSLLIILVICQIFWIECKQTFLFKKWRVRAKTRHFNRNRGAIIQYGVCNSPADAIVAAGWAVAPFLLFCYSTRLDCPIVTFFVFRCRPPIPACYIPPCHMDSLFGV